MIVFVIYYRSFKNWKEHYSNSFNNETHTHSSIGEGNCWKEVIYPGMKKALINVLQVIQDEVEQKKVAS